VEEHDPFKRPMYFVYKLIETLLPKAMIKFDPNKPIEIKVRGMEKFTLQQLSSFVSTNQQLNSITIPATKQTDDMVRLIESLVSKNADLSVPTTRKFNG
jgi:hypothetical protein